MVAKNRHTNSLDAFLGFITLDQYDSTLARYNDLWLVTWKRRSEVAVPGLGKALEVYLKEQLNPRSCGAFGISTVALHVFKQLNYKIGLLNHFYLVNRKKHEFQLLGNFDGKYDTDPSSISAEKKFVRYDKTSFTELSKKLTYVPPGNQAPVKSLLFFYNRYLAHPVYNYHMYAIENKELTVAVMVVRLAAHQSARALKLIDYFGNPEALAGSLNSFQQLLQHYDAEYLEFYNYGLNPEILAAAGFLKREAGDPVIVPNYFEPFKQKNVDLDFAYQAGENLNYIFFKGDTDQDRPNRIE